MLSLLFYILLRIFRNIALQWLKSNTFDLRRLIKLMRIRRSFNLSPLTDKLLLQRLLNLRQLALSPPPQRR